MSLILSGTDGLSDVDGTAAAPAIRGTDTNTGIFFPAADTVGVATGGSERLRVDSSGLVGIGTASPNASYKLTISGAGSGVIGGLAIVDTDAYSFSIYSASSALLFRDVTNSAERMRINSGGNLLINGTDSGGRVNITNTGATILRLNTPSTSNTAIQFVYNTSTQVGAVTTTTTATAYGTSSDYRLKEAIAPMTGALDKVALLKPVTYRWKSTGETTQGFVAHELQAVVPECVVGEKDAVDADGNPQYQGIDTSFLVATLTAALQEAHGLIKNLEQRVAALEAA